jgi:hypothetical protein
VVVVTFVPTSGEKTTGARCSVVRSAQEVLHNPEVAVCLLAVMRIALVVRRAHHTAGGRRAAIRLAGRPVIRTSRRRGRCCSEAAPGPGRVARGGQTNTGSGSSLDPQEGPLTLRGVDLTGG